MPRPSGKNLLALTGSDAVPLTVQNVASHLQGHKDAWEAIDTDRSWWDRHKDTLLAGAILVLDVASIAGAATCAITAAAGCALSLFTAGGAAMLSTLATKRTCDADSESVECGYSRAAVGMDRVFHCWRASGYPHGLSRRSLQSRGE